MIARRERGFTSTSTFAVLLAGVVAATVRAQVPADTTGRTGEDTAALQVGHATWSAGNATGALTRLPGVDSASPASISPGQLLGGRVPGLVVAAGDEPGGLVAVRIRGAGGDPLYVVDGVPVATGTGGGLSSGRDPLNVLDPSDIESITVLRDASLEAMYGMNGANGVVLITTKSGGGVPGQGAVVEYSTQASAASVVRLPQVLGAAAFRAAVAHDDSLNIASNAAYSARLPMLGDASTDWFGAIDRAGYGTEQRISVAGAGPSRSYRVALGYLRQDGVIQRSATERLSLGLSLDQRLLGDRLDMALDLHGARVYDTYQSGVALGEAALMAPSQPIADASSVTGYWNWPGSAPAPGNPAEDVTLSRVNGTTWRGLGSLRLDYAMPFLDALHAGVSVGYGGTRISSVVLYPPDLYSQQLGADGYDARGEPRQSVTTLEADVHYAAPLHVLGGRIDATAGVASARSHTSAQDTTTTNLGGTPSVAWQAYAVEDALTSLFGRLSYDLGDRWLVGLSLRRDGSSRFSPSNRQGTFPAASAAWHLSGEPFFRALAAVADLTLRVSWARTGNQGLGDTALAANASVDPNLRWERTSAWDAGLDYGVARGRIRGTVDWYTAKTTDLILTIPVAAGSNFSNLLTTNAGAIRHRGLELSLTAVFPPARRGGLGYTATFTAAHDVNRVLSVNAANGTTQLSSSNAVEEMQPGYPISSFLVCRQYYQNGQPVDGQYVARDGSVVSGCDARSWRPYHSPAPTWAFGHTSRLTYGAFDLGFTLRAYVGNYAYNAIAATDGSYENVSAGAVPSNMSTSVLATGFAAPQPLSDYYVQDASFLRMDNLTLGYTFDVRGRPWRVFVTVQNAFTITGYGGVDPGAVLDGVDEGLYPLARTVSGGLSVRL